MMRDGLIGAEGTPMRALTDLSLRRARDGGGGVLGAGWCILFNLNNAASCCSLHSRMCCALSQIIFEWELLQPVWTSLTPTNALHCCATKSFRGCTRISVAVGAVSPIATAQLCLLHDDVT